jgi:hypothetical protein
MIASKSFKNSISGLNKFECDVIEELPTEEGRNRDSPKEISEGSGVFIDFNQPDAFGKQTKVEDLKD